MKNLLAFDLWHFRGDAQLKPHDPLRLYNPYPYRFHLLIWWFMGVLFIFELIKTVFAWTGIL